MWRRTNALKQSQAGYSTAHVLLPIGDATAVQMHALAEIARNYAGGHIRTAASQNFVLRWIHDEDLAAEKERLAVTLRSIGDGFITTDNGGRVLMLNNVAEQLTGWSQERATDKPLTDVFRLRHERTRRPLTDVIKTIVDQGSADVLAGTTVIEPTMAPSV